MILIQQIQGREKRRKKRKKGSPGGLREIWSKGGERGRPEGGARVIWAFVGDIRIQLRGCAVVRRIWVLGETDLGSNFSCCTLTAWLQISQSSSPSPRWLICEVGITSS